jgi:hypothetical protein
VPGFRHHFIVTREGAVVNTTDIQYPVSLITGPNYDRDKYNNCSICIRYCGSLQPNAWLIDRDSSCSAVLGQRAALLQLLVKLRQHFPDAKILGLSELDGRELYCKNVIVSDAMNLLRNELSELP